MKGKQKAAEIPYYQATPETKNYGGEGEVDVPRDSQDRQEGHSPRQFDFNNKIDQPGDGHDFDDNDNENDNGKDNGKGKATDDIDADDDVDDVDDVDEDDENDEDNVEESGEGPSVNKSKPGHFSKAALQEIEDFGKRCCSEAEQLAAKYGKNTSQVMMKAGLSIRPARAANIYNNFRS